MSQAASRDQDVSHGSAVVREENSEQTGREKTNSCGETGESFGETISCVETAGCSEPNINSGREESPIFVAECYYSTVTFPAEDSTSPGQTRGERLGSSSSDSTQVCRVYSTVV